MRRTLGAVGLVLLVACGNVRDRELPALADTDKVAEIAKKLTPSERELITGYMLRRSVGGSEFPEKITVAQAIAAQRDFVANGGSGGGSAAGGGFAQMAAQPVDDACSAATAQVREDEVTRVVTGSYTPADRVRLLSALREKAVRAVGICRKMGISDIGLNRLLGEEIEPQLRAAKSSVREFSTFKMSLRTLLNDYKSNEVRADSLYKSQLVEVRGRVRDTKRDVLNDIYVTVGTGAEFEIPVVQCFLDESQAAQASALRKGQEVTVRGRVNGLMMNVSLHDCELVAQ